jgi:hypothetical protein
MMGVKLKELSICAPDAEFLLDISVGVVPNVK